MKLLKPILALCMFIFAVVYWVSSQPKHDLEIDSLIESVAKDFTIEDLMGKKVQLSQFKGKNILLNFWATWCAPCIEEFPELEKLAVWGEKNADLIIIAVSVDKKASDLTQFLKTRASSQPSNFKVLFDKEIAASSLYGTIQFPESFFIDKTFQVKRKFIGIQKWNSEEMKKWFVQQN